MECLYLPEVDESTRIAIPNESEKKHIRALRLKNNEKVMISNGKGLCFTASLQFDKDYHPNLIIEEILENYGEPTHTYSIFVCSISDKNRLEWIVEKSVELGVAEIFLKNCKYSQQTKIDLSRLTNKAIAALKQSKRAILPKITLLEDKKFLPSSLVSNFGTFILLNQIGENPLQTEIEFPLLILVGPEGGFASSEIESIEKLTNLKHWKLANRRLRTETAVITALGIVQSKSMDISH